MKQILILVALFLLSSTPSKAAVLTFEEAPSNSTLINYGGFNWINTSVQEQYGNKYAYNVNHLDMVAKLEDTSSVIKLERLYLQSRNWQGGFRLPMNLIVEGYLNNIFVHSKEVYVNGGNSFTLANLNFNNIDEFKIIASEHCNNYSVDNIDYAVPNPEPSSMVLGFMGIASLLGLRKKTA
jgi:hypothetical protein